MHGSSDYWIGGQPPGGQRWSCAEFGTVLDDVATRQALFGMHGRYVRQWNAIELDPKRSLLEHTYQVLDAKILAADGSFVLHGRADYQSHWILEILFRRGFKEFYPWTLERNAMRSTADMRSVHLHWSGSGREAFARWLEEEQAPPREPASGRSILVGMWQRLRAMQPRARNAEEVPRRA
ncbi:hypothetical protein [Variovorax sp. YR566]|uniref:hypothetical protein n=1 Tax=Variovorax sp. YR566 TaxID=3450237 RepID=UPI003F7FEBF0